MRRLSVPKVFCKASVHEKSRVIQPRSRFSENSKRTHAQFYVPTRFLLGSRCKRTAPATNQTETEGKGKQGL
ncbi:MAG: hypothetical protein DMF00_01660 [Verrucomicrobia bacterium]|nr:MAG: hypothetical protein DMF00_01660 [Verrucomicrobiota bacterium]